MSVETYHPSVTTACLKAGAKILNLTGTANGDEIFREVADFDAGVILCFVQGDNVRAVGDLDGFTCTGFTPVSIEPPLIVVSVTNSQSPLAILTESDAFAVNLLAPDQEALGNAFSRPVTERPDLWS